MENLAHEEILALIDRIKEKDLYENVKENKFDGYILANFTEEMFGYFFKNPKIIGQYFIFKNRVSKSNLNSRNTPKTPTRSSLRATRPIAIAPSGTPAPQAVNIQQPIETATTTLPSDTESTNDILSSSYQIVSLELNNHSIDDTFTSNQESLNKDEQWPLFFEFPKDRLSVDLARNLENPQFELKKPHVKEIVEIIFNKMRSYNMLYPDHLQYYEAANSFNKEFPHLIPRNSDVLNEIKKKLRSKFADMRRSPSMNTLDEIKSAKQKYGIKAKLLSGEKKAQNSEDFSYIRSEIF